MSDDNSDDKESAAREGHFRLVIDEKGRRFFVAGDGPPIEADDATIASTGKSLGKDGAFEYALIIPSDATKPVKIVSFPTADCPDDLLLKWVKMRRDDENS